jgi:hypothetical protein
VPGISRYEIFDSNWSNILPNEHHQPWLESYQKNYLIYDQNSELNRRKNLNAMQHICNKHSVPFYYDLLEDFVDGALARDLMHCGPDAHKNLANKFLQKIRSQ